MAILASATALLGAGTSQAGTALALCGYNGTYLQENAGKCPGYAARHTYYEATAYRVPTNYMDLVLQVINDRTGNELFRRTTGSASYIYAGRSDFPNFYTRPYNRMYSKGLFTYGETRYLSATY